MRRALPSIALVAMMLMLVLGSCRIVPVEEMPSDSESDSQTTASPKTDPPVTDAITTESPVTEPNTTAAPETAPSGSIGLAYAPNYAEKTCTILGPGSALEREIEIPAVIDGLRVTAIARAAFADCTELAVLRLPDTLCTIGPEAFAGCSSLSALSIPKGVVSIGMGAFTGCSSLREVTFAQPRGWEVAGDSIRALLDAEEAATQLRLLSHAAWLCTKGADA